MHAKGVFNPNFSIFSPSSAEGLHFSGFHLFMKAKSFYILHGVGLF